MGLMSMTRVTLVMAKMTRNSDNNEPKIMDTACKQAATVSGGGALIFDKCPVLADCMDIWVTLHVRGVDVDTCVPEWQKCLPTCCQPTVHGSTAPFQKEQVMGRRHSRRTVGKSACTRTT